MRAEAVRLSRIGLEKTLVQRYFLARSDCDGIGPD